MRGLLIIVLVTVLGCDSSARSPSESATPTGAAAAHAEALPFAIVNRETQIKNIDYPIWVVKAALLDSSKLLTKEVVSDTLAALLDSLCAEAAKEGKVYAITAFLYQSGEHANGANVALGRAEWWPKNHTFDSSNLAEVENVSSHVVEIEVFSVPQRIGPDASVSSLPEARRREIFLALVQSQDRATRDAEARYPTDISRMPLRQIRSYDMKGAVRKNFAENDRLRQRYERELLTAFKLKEPQLRAIEREASANQWPIPKP